MPALEVRDLVKAFGNVQAVRGVSFDVAEGEIFGLIGPNGAGKTTTLRVISTLLQVTAGSVKVCGHDVTGEADDVRRIISYLPEDAGAYKNLTGVEYLTFIASFFRHGAERREMVERGRVIADLGARLDDT